MICDKKIDGANEFDDEGSGIIRDRMNYGVDEDLPTVFLLLLGDTNVDTFHLCHRGRRC